MRGWPGPAGELGALSPMGGCAPRTCAPGAGTLLVFRSLSLQQGSRNPAPAPWQEGLTPDLSFVAIECSLWPKPRRMLKFPLATAGAERAGQPSSGRFILAKLRAAAGRHNAPLPRPRAGPVVGNGVSDPALGTPNLIQPLWLAIAPSTRPAPVTSSPARPRRIPPACKGVHRNGRWFPKNQTIS